MLRVTPFWEQVLRRTNAAAARKMLGIVGILPSGPADGDFLVGDGTDWVQESGATARTSMGLGDIAEENAPLSVGKGGIGVASLTDGGPLLGSGTGAITAMAVLADGEFIVGDGAGDPVAESGATARDSLGLGSSDTPTFAGINLGDENLNDYDEGTWTPVLTFGTPGDLNVVYAAQVGSYTRVGDLVTVELVVQTSTFTHTTASGNLQITGLPFTSANVPAQNFYGATKWGGITKANFTDVNSAIVANASFMSFNISGSGQTPVRVAVGDTPTGGTMRLFGNLQYKV